MSFGPGHESRFESFSDDIARVDGPEDKVDVDVLVIGAGPTGLVAAGEAVRHGLSVRIVDRKPCRSTFSKALVAHARTLEIFETMGVVEAALAEGPGSRPSTRTSGAAADR